MEKEDCLTFDKTVLHNFVKQEGKGDLTLLSSAELEQLSTLDVEKITRTLAEIKRCKEELSTAVYSSLISHLKHRIFYLEYVLEIRKQYQKDIKCILHKRKCSSIIAKHNDFLRVEPYSSFITIIPLSLFELIDNTVDTCHLFKTDPFKTQYLIWKETQTDERRKESQMQLLIMFCHLTERCDDSQVILQVFNSGKETPIEIPVWFKKLYILKNSTLPTAVVNELFERGMNEEEIRTLFPEHHLPSQRLN